MLLSRPLTHVNGDVAGVLEGVAGKLDDAQLKALASALAQVGDTGLADITNQLIDTDQPVVATPLTDNAAPASDRGGLPQATSDLSSTAQTTPD